MTDYDQELRFSQPGQKSWILKFAEIDTVDESKASYWILAACARRRQTRVVGRDLIAMKVLLKETGDLVGTVVKVFDNAASDLLQVMLNTICWSSGYN